MRERSWSACAALCLAAGTAPAQLVIGNDQAGPTIWLVDVSGARPNRALVTGAAANVTSLAADDAGATLYWITANNVLYRAPYLPAGALSPVLIGTVSGVPSDVTGLAWDAADQRLIGKANNGLYTLSTTTAAATILYSMTAQDFGGLDYDPASDAFYAANDSVLTTAIPGRGVYRISKPLSSPAFTRVALYPANNTDIDGLAVGGGRVYLVNDSAGELIYTLNLATGQYETPRASPMTGTGTTAGATWAPGLIPAVVVADVSAAVAAPAACSVLAGQVMRFEASVHNAGPQAASGAALTVTLPANAAFVGSTPPLAPASGRLVLSAGTLAAGASASVMVDVTAPPDGTVQLTAEAASTTTDPSGANNIASASSAVRPSPPGAPAASAVLCTLPAAANSLIAGQGGARFAALDRLSPSPSGRRWTLGGRADGPAASAGVLLVGDGDSYAVVARQGLSPVLPTMGAGPRVPRTIDPATAVNDAGRYAFSGEDDRAGTADDGFVVRHDGAGLVLVAQESYAVPALGPNARYGARRGSLTMQQDGSVAFFTSLSGAAVTGATDEALLALDGSWLIARKGVTVPFGQAGAFPFAAFDDAGTPGLGFAMTPDWAGWAATGTLTDVPTQDRVATVNNSVVVQEGWQVWQVPAACTARDGTPAEFLGAGPDGAWWCAGSCAQGASWVMRGNALVAQSGGETLPGSGEHWAAGPGAFFAACANARGDVLLGGATDRGGRAAGVLVLNGERVLLRLNDPIDADGNGVFDDATYLHSVAPWQVFLDEAGDVRALVRLRSEAAALCGEADAVIGHALLHLRLGPPPCDPDANADGNADQDDVSYLINVIGGGQNPTGFDPDFNRDGNADQDDVTAIIAVIAGDACP